MKTVGGGALPKASRVLSGCSNAQRQGERTWHGILRSATVRFQQGFSRICSGINTLHGTVNTRVSSPFASVATDAKTCLHCSLPGVAGAGALSCTSSLWSEPQAARRKVPPISISQMLMAASCTCKRGPVREAQGPQTNPSQHHLNLPVLLLFLGRWIESLVPGSVALSFDCAYHV